MGSGSLDKIPKHNIYLNPQHAYKKTNRNLKQYKMVRHKFWVRGYLLTFYSCPDPPPGEEIPPTIQKRRGGGERLIKDL